MYDGTWASGAVPDEIRDFELMREMNWSWPDLQACPPYVRQYCWDFTLMRRKGRG